MNYEQFSTKLNEFNAQQIQTLMTLTEKSFERSQKISDMSFDTTKSILDEAHNTFSKILNAKNPQTMMTINQEEDFDSLTRKLTAHQKFVTKIVRDVVEEVIEISETSMAQMNTSLQEWLDSATENGPEGSDVFVNLIKTFIETSLQSFTQVQAAAKEVIHNVEKSTDQAVDTIKNQVATVKKVTTKTVDRTTTKKTASIAND